MTKLKFLRIVLRLVEQTCVLVNGAIFSSYVRMFLERGDPEICSIDKGVKNPHNRWKDKWFDNVDVNGVKLSEYGKKVNQAGIIYCQPCEKYLKYYSSGISDITNRHASKQSHYDKYLKWKYANTLKMHGKAIAEQEKSTLEQKRAEHCEALRYALIFIARGRST